MKQFCYEIYDTNDMEENLRDVRQYLNAHRSSAVLAHLYAGYTERGRLELIIDALRAIVPEAMIVSFPAFPALDVVPVCGPFTTANLC